MPRVKPYAIHPGDAVTVRRLPGIFEVTPTGPRMVVAAGAEGIALARVGVRRWLVQFGERQVEVPAQAIVRPRQEAA